MNNQNIFDTKLKEKGEASNYVLFKIRTSLIKEIASNSRSLP